MTNSIPGQIPTPQADADPTHTNMVDKEFTYHWPDGKDWHIRTRESTDQGPGTDPEQYRTFDPDIDVRKVESEIAALNARLDDFTGYDRDGQPVYVLQGHARKVAEMQRDFMAASTLPYQKQRAAEIRQIQANLPDLAAEEAARMQRIEERALQIAEEVEAKKIAAQLLSRRGFRG